MAEAEAKEVKKLLSALLPEHPEDKEDKLEKIKTFAAKKKKCERLAQQIVERCVLVTDEPTGAVSKEFLIKVGNSLTHDHLDDIMTERAIVGNCGWATCSNQLGAVPKQKYKICKNKVLDITERKNFCSSECYTSFLHYKSQIPTSPLWLRDEEEEEERPEIRIVSSADIDEKTTIHGMTLDFNDLDLK